MYPLDCVPDDIIVNAWLHALREKTITRAISWTVTPDTLKAKLNERYTFIVANHVDAYFVSIRQNVHNNNISSIDWATIVNAHIRENLFVAIRAFDAEIRQYVTAEPHWQKMLSEFHLLIMSVH